MCQQMTLECELPMPSSRARASSRKPWSRYIRVTTGHPHPARNIEEPEHTALQSYNQPITCAHARSRVNPSIGWYTVSTVQVHIQR